MDHDVDGWKWREIRMAARTVAPRAYRHGSHAMDIRHALRVKRRPFIPKRENERDGEFFVEEMGNKATTGEREATASSFSMMSYNVWFDEYEMAERMKAIGLIIDDKKPDVIVMQVSRWLLKV